MRKFTKEELTSLAKDLMFEVNDNEVEIISENSKSYFYNLSLLEKVDTEGVESQSYPFESPRTNLRKDEINHVIDREDALKNAPKTEGGYVEVVQVIDK